VKERRGMDDELLEKVADGRVFTGRQAVDLKLIDQLGDEKTAIAWLVAQKNIKSDLPVRDFKLSPRFGDLTFLRTAASITLDALGLGSIARQVEQGGWHVGALVACGVQLNAISTVPVRSSRIASVAGIPNPALCHAFSRRAI
jgi:ClpP class serine protease